MPTWRHDDDPASFQRQVRDGLEHLHNPGYLAIHPLARALARDDHAFSGDRVRRTILAAIEQLRPLTRPEVPDADWRRYRYLVLRYIEGTPHDQVADSLGVSTRQASRDHQQAVAALSELLRLGERSPMTMDLAGPRSATTTGHPPAKTEGTAEDQHSADLAETLNGVLRTIVHLVRMAPSPPLIQTSVSDTLPRLAVEPALLRQAILNLVVCAIQIAAGREVFLRASDTADGVSLLIEAKRGSTRDSIPTEAEELRTAGRQILETQRASLEVFDQGVAASARQIMRITLPPVPMRIVLVVDDNPDFVILFRRFLRAAPYRVIQATSGSSAIRTASELCPDTIILDVMLPSVDGWDVLRQLRNDPRLATTPVIICSVLPEKALAASLGVSEFLAKPISQASLLAALERCQSVRHPAEPAS